MCIFLCVYYIMVKLKTNLKKIYRYEIQDIKDIYIEFQISFKFYRYNRDSRLMKFQNIFVEYAITQNINIHVIFFINTQDIYQHMPTNTQAYFYNCIKSAEST